MYKKLKTAIAAVMLLSLPQMSFAQSPDLASVEQFTVFTSVGAFNSVGTTSITGDIGTNVGAFSGFPPGIVLGAIENENATSATAALDLADVYTDLSTRTCDVVLSVTIGGGMTLTPANYCTGAATALTGAIILDGAGDPNALFIIQIDGAFSAATFSSVSLINGASACNVFWQINGAVEIGENASFAGNIVANGAITFLSTASLNGRALTIAGEIALSSNSMEQPASQNYYADMDNDGYGDPFNMLSDCSMPLGYVDNDMDCDDMNNMINPLAVELCNSIDDDCDGLTDNLAFNATIYPNDTAFSCKSVDFVFATDSCLGCSYQWFKNDNIIIGATNPTYATTKPAYYSVQVTMPGGCASVSSHTLLHMNPNPNANIFEPNGLNICAPAPGNNILLKVNYLETNNYQWYRDGSPYMGEGADTWRIYPTMPGIYYCAISTMDGCARNTASRNVINACKIGDLQNQLSIFPNPVASEINISMVASDLSGDATIQIVSVLGEVVYFENCETSNNTLDKTISVNQLAPGMYTVRVIADTQLSAIQFIKQ